jgi:glutamyl/glutaminyl-tRNA synthetase
MKKILICFFIIFSSCSNYEGSIKNLNYDEIKIEFDGYSENYETNEKINISVTDNNNIKKLNELPELIDFFFHDELDYEAELLIWKKSTKEETKLHLQELYDFLNNIKESNWEEKYLEETIINYLKENNKKLGDYLWPLRVALTGKKNSPGPFEVASILKKEASLKRIKSAITVI